MQEFHGIEYSIELPIHDGKEHTFLLVLRVKIRLSKTRLYHYLCKAHFVEVTILPAHVHVISFWSPAPLLSWLNFEWLLLQTILPSGKLT